MRKKSECGLIIPADEMKFLSNLVHLNDSLKLDLDKNFYTTLSNFIWCIVLYLKCYGIAMVVIHKNERYLIILSLLLRNL